MRMLEELNMYLEKQKAFTNIIEEHPLGRCSENIKKVYITLLKIVLKDQEYIEEKQLVFLNRLMQSVNLENIELDYAMETAEKNYVGAIGGIFLKYFRTSELKYNFVLDLLLLLMQASDVQKHFMWLICENLEFKEPEISFLMNLATCILEEDSTSYMQLIERAPKKIKVKNFVCYVKSFLVGRLIDDDTAVVYYSNNHLDDKPSFNEIFKSEEMSLERWVFKQDLLVFENWQIDLTHKNWQFRNNQKVIFKNCEIIGDNYPISFDGVAEIIIENSSFTYFSNRVFLINDCVTLKITACQFKECVYLYDLYQNSNGCIYFIADKAITETDKVRSIEIVNSTFVDCSVWNKEGHYYSDYSLGYSMNVPQRLINCNFKNCLSYMGTPKRLCNVGSTLFNGAEEEGCTIIASHPIL